jgi:hypothetical protein
VDPLTAKAETSLPLEAQVLAVAEAVYSLLRVVAVVQLVSTLVQGAMWAEKSLWLAALAVRAEVFTFALMIARPLLVM